MTKFELLSKLNGIKCAIMYDSYVEDSDGYDDEGHSINRKVFYGMNESDTENVLESIEKLIDSIRESKEVK